MPGPGPYGNKKPKIRDYPKMSSEKRKRLLREKLANSHPKAKWGLR